MQSTMITVEEAQRRILDRVTQTPVAEVPVWRAAGLPLAEDVRADMDLSPFAASAMDGYAVRCSDLAPASPEHPVDLPVVAHEAAGSVMDVPLEAGTAVRIMTGAPAPEGADAVVKYEIVDVLEGDGNEGSRVRFTAPAKPGDNIREPGLEAKAGSLVMRAGEVCTAAGAGLLASAGRTSVKVHRAPTVAIISVGSELVAPSEMPARGQIRDANASALMAEALQAHAAPTFLGIVGDDPAMIGQRVIGACRAYDLVVTSGGASMGDYDYIERVIADRGEVVFDLISMKPGKAITFGLIDGTPVLGLSGNPAAAYVGFEMLARPAIRKMLGFATYGRPEQSARVTHDVKKNQARRFYNRARVERDAETGELAVTQERSQNSALLGTMHRSNALLVVPDGMKGYEAGDVATVVRTDVDEDVVL